ncbi:MAG: hypothetical protein EOP09_16665 [Proteobacteria bacterium]|nr:MAG: hypothetical protein EOP09_16665 [Pseudomonadota bacterium]
MLGPFFFGTLLSDLVFQVLEPLRCCIFADLGKALITVEVSLPSERETELRLTHAGLPERMHDDCVDGWSSSLDKLKRLVEKH